MTNADSRSQRGFTLAETLVAMLLMSFVGLIVTGGIAMGARVYGRIVERSNAELLLSTTLLELRDQLDRVQEVRTVTNSGVTTLYYRDRTSNWKALTSLGRKSDDGTPEANSKVPGNEQFLERYPNLLKDNKMPRGIYLTEFSGYSIAGAPTEADVLNTQLMVSDEAAGKSLYATYESIEYKDGNFVITGLRVCNKNTGAVIAWLDRDKNRNNPDGYSYLIRPLEKITEY